MIVYIEQVLIDNLSINYFLLWFSAAVFKQNFSRFRLFLASVLGTIFAFIFPLFVITPFVLFLLKMLVGLAMVLTAFKFENLKKTCAIFFLFLLSTFVLGGTIFALFFAIVANLKTENGTFVYTSNIPIGFFVVVAGVFFKFFYDSLKIARSRQELTEKIFVLRIYHKHKKIEINAFLDTGNVLIDNVTKAPVTVISFKVFQKLFNVKTIEFLKGNYKIENSRYIPVTDALKTSKMLVFNVDKIEVVQNGVASIINNPLLGLSTSNFSSKLLCDAIIGETFLKLGEVNV